MNFLNFQINIEDKDRVKKFIELNELDYDILDDNFSKKFGLEAYNGIIFFIYQNEEMYYIAKFDPNEKDYKKAFTYFPFTTLSQLLEQLKYYDDSLEKTYWETTDGIEIGFDKDSYKDDWYKDFQRDAEFSKVVKEEDYDYLTYDNPNYSPNVQSPYNTLHIDAPHPPDIRKVDKLYYEIHPISLEDNKEFYLFKLLANNEEVLKEYINYKVYKQKGLKLLIEDIFNSLKKK